MHDWVLCFQTAVNWPWAPMTVLFMSTSSTRMDRSSGNSRQRSGCVLHSHRVEHCNTGFSMTTVRFLMTCFLCKQSRSKWNALRHVPVECPILGTFDWGFKYSALFWKFISYFANNGFRLFVLLFLLFLLLLLLLLFLVYLLFFLRLFLFLLLLLLRLLLLRRRLLLLLLLRLFLLGFLGAVLPVGRGEYLKLVVKW